MSRFFGVPPLGANFWRGVIAFFLTPALKTPFVSTSQKNNKNFLQFRFWMGFFWRIIRNIHFFVIFVSKMGIGKKYIISILSFKFLWGGIVCFSCILVLRAWHANILFPRPHTRTWGLGQGKLTIQPPLVALGRDNWCKLIAGPKEPSI